MTKLETVRLNTISEPASIPGSDSGTVIRQKHVQPLAPSPLAAGVRAGSIRSRLPINGSTIYASITCTMPMTTAVSLYSIFGASRPTAWNPSAIGPFGPSSTSHPYALVTMEMSSGDSSTRER
ncbi:hypothetical protein R8789_04620 [Streptomyces malaysiensis]|nr:hypothetical protein R8789_04620 [Streptomyces malaysiensis]